MNQHTLPLLSRLLYKIVHLRDHPISLVQEHSIRTNLIEFVGEVLYILLLEEVGYLVNCAIDDVGDVVHEDGFDVLNKRGSTRAPNYSAM